MDTTHWRYFLSIEEDFIRTTKFVELHSDNFNTYSIEFTKIYLTICSEIDVVCKILCNEVLSNNTNNINQYRDVLTSKYPHFPDNEIIIESVNLAFKPWEEWKNGINPDWWRNYNNVKHQRNKFYQEASLKNTINSLVGLFILEFHYYGEKYNQFPPIKAKLIGDSYFGGAWVTGPEKKMIDLTHIV